MPRAAVSSSSKALTPMAFVRAVLTAYEKYGVDSRQGLRAAGLSSAQTKKVHARVGVDQLEALSATAMQELDDEALGWFSRRLPWAPTVSSVAPRSERPRSRSR